MRQHTAVIIILRDTLLYGCHAHWTIALAQVTQVEFWALPLNCLTLSSSFHFSLCINGSDSNFNLLICICRDKINNSCNQYLLWGKLSVLHYFSEEFVFSLVFVLGTFLFAIESIIRRHVINSLYCWSCNTKILSPLHVTPALLESIFSSGLLVHYIHNHQPPLRHTTFENNNKY